MPKITCIIIDDKKESADRTEAVLRLFGEIELIKAINNPNGAVKPIILHKPDIVLLEIEMVQKDGFELMKEVREAGSFPAFIITTSSHHHIITAIRNGAFDYLLKPIDVDELKKTIKRLQSKLNDPGVRIINTE